MTKRDPSLVGQEAARWVARMDRADWGQAEESELAAWLMANPRGEGDLLRAQAGWISLDIDKVVPARRLALTMPRLQRRTMLAGGVAAMAASFAALLFYDRSARYDTELGEIRRVALADGSTAAINTDSGIAVNFNGGIRQVRLARGEAWFQVKPERARPFLVEAGAIRVRAVGTAFSVRRREQGADVIVTEGVVAVWTEESANEPVSARAGMHLYVPDEPSAEKPIVMSASSGSSLSWRSGQIDLTARPLGDAAAEFNRYNRRQIVVSDPAILNERMDGIFRTDDPEGFATAVHHVLGVPLDFTSAEITLGGKVKKM